MLAIFVDAFGIFVASTYTTMYLKKVTSDDWDHIHVILSSRKYHLITLATVIFGYIVDTLHAVCAAIKKCMKECEDSCFHPILVSMPNPTLGVAILIATPMGVVSLVRCKYYCIFLESGVLLIELCTAYNIWCSRGTPCG